MRVTKLGGQHGHGVGAVISKSQLCSWSGSQDIKDLVNVSRDNITIQDPAFLFFTTSRVDNLGLI